MKIIVHHHAGTLSKTCLVLIFGLLASACSQSTDTLKPVATDQPLVSGAPEIGRISSSGGTKIAVLVNKTPITSNQIKRRAAFVKLRRMKGNSTKIATDELIDDAIKLQEARRIGVAATDAEVNSAYIKFAKNNKMTVKAFDGMLARTGVTKRGFKDYIRAAMSWQRAVATKAQVESSQGGGGTPSWLPAVGTQSSKETEYTIQQVIFIVPQGRRGAIMSQRRVEAQRFRSQFTGCDGTRQLAAGLKDVSVLDRGRMLESELPSQWAKSIKATPEGKLTRPQDDARGVEMIAVCKTREVVGQASDIDAGVLSGNAGNNSASSAEKKYFQDIKAKAVIQRR